MPATNTRLRSATMRPGSCAWSTTLSHKTTSKVESAKGNSLAHAVDVLSLASGNRARLRVLVTRADALTPDARASRAARCFPSSLVLLDSCLDVVRALAGSELDDSIVGEAALDEWIFFHNCLDLAPTVADGQDDAAVSRNFTARHEKIACRVVLFQ